MRVPTRNLPACNNKHSVLLASSLQSSVMTELWNWLADRVVVTGVHSDVVDGPNSCQHSNHTIDHHDSNVQPQLHTHWLHCLYAHEMETSLLGLAQKTVQRF